MKNITTIRSMDDKEFISRAWEILTNIPECGGASKSAMPLARRRFRLLGGKMFLALCSEETDDTATGEAVTRKWGQWGIIWAGENPPVSDSDYIVTGTSLAHCAAKLAGGDAGMGWSIYWGHS
jgi:hypothetical protein